MVIMVTLSENIKKDEEVRKNIRENLRRSENKKNHVAGASIIWYGGSYLSFVIVFLGLLWLLTNAKIISLPPNSIYPIILILVGVGIAVLSLYLRNIIRQSSFME